MVLHCCGWKNIPHHLFGAHIVDQVDGDKTVLLLNGPQSTRCWSRGVVEGENEDWVLRNSCEMEEGKEGELSLGRAKSHILNGADRSTRILERPRNWL